MADTQPPAKRPRCANCRKRIPARQCALARALGKEPRFCGPSCRNVYHVRESRARRRAAIASAPARIDHQDADADEASAVLDPDAAWAALREAAKRSLLN